MPTPSNVGMFWRGDSPPATLDYQRPKRSTAIPRSMEQFDITLAAPASGTLSYRHYRLKDPEAAS
ncbi:MAG: hypothetical protein WEE51_04530 [Pirellulaceae bacterium]